MRPFPMPPSSPTPHSTQDQEGAPPLVGDMNSNSRRALTRAASSDVESGRHASYTNSTGYVTARGLINWRRKKRRSTAARSTAGSDNGKLGPGMGMQGTPARRKKRRTGTGKRIGLSSTPKGLARTIVDHSQSISFLSLSSLPDSDDSAGNESTFIVPDMASLDLTPIQTTQATETSVDVFGIMTFIKPFNPIPLGDGDASRSSGGLQPSATTPSLFGELEDLTVPVAFPSSEIQSPEMQEAGEDDTETEVARGLMRQSGGRFQIEYMIPLKFSSPSQLDADREGGSNATARPDAQPRLWTPTANSTTSYADATVPLDDVSNSSASRRLTASLMRTSGAATTRFSDSRIGSRAQDRVSTPYHRQAPVATESDIDIAREMSSGAVQTMKQKVTSDTGKTKRVRTPDILCNAGHVSDEPSPMRQGKPHDAQHPTRPAIRSRSCCDETADLAQLSPSQRAYPYPDNIGCVETGHLRCGTYSPCTEIPVGARSLADATFGDPEPFFDPVHLDLDLEVDRLPRSPRTHSPSGSSTASILGWFPPFVRGAATPVPFLPSSQLGTPLPVSDLSPVSFETTLSGTPNLETRSVTSSLTSLSAIADRVDRRAGRVQVREEQDTDCSATLDSSRNELGTRWRGGKVLGRMGG